MLYSADARVYIAARSQERADGAIEDIKASSPNSKGHIEFLKLDLGDLSTVRSTVECFLAKENRLHVLFNNAGVQSANADTTTQGHEIHLGVNCVGPHLLTKLLTPTLVETAKLEPAGTVRVVWVSSASADLMGEKNMGIDMTNLDYHEDKDFLYKYGMSKMGNLLQAFEYAKRQYAHGIISVPINPGNLQSELYRDQQSWLAKLAIKLVMYPPILGAHTELFAGFSPTASETNPGTWGKSLQ